MKNIVIKRLFDSFGELEGAITAARKIIEQKPKPPEEVLQRIDTYDEILSKQRGLASALCGHAIVGNWQEVERHIKLINAYSTLIRDDAKDVLSMLRPTSGPDEQELLLS